MFKIKSFTFNPIGENTYLLYNESNQCIIIDPGCYFDQEKDTLKAFIAQNELKPTQLLNTHCHLDHVFGEKLVLAYAPTSGLMYNLPFDSYEGEFILLKEGDILLLGQDELKVIEVPGHSPGSICFYCAKQHFLIGGDVLFQGSIGRTDLPLGDHQALLHHIKSKLLVLPEETVVYSGHGATTTIGEEKANNPYLR